MRPSAAAEVVIGRGGWRLPREAIIALLVLLVLWELASRNAALLGVPAFAIPSLERIAKSLITVTWVDVVVTVARVLGALLCSFALAALIAIWMYCVPRVERYAYPLVRLLMAVPVISWILFAVLWFKHVEFRIGFVLVAVCGPLFLVDMLSSMKGVSKELRDMVHSFRPSTSQLFRKLMLPAILPALLTSWKINLSLAIRVVTIAELVGAVTGMGHQLSVAQELFSVADVFAWTLVLVAVLFALEAVLNQIEARVLRWRA